MRAVWLPAAGRRGAAGRGPGGGGSGSASPAGAAAARGGMVKTTGSLTTPCSGAVDRLDDDFHGDARRDGSDLRSAPGARGQLIFRLQARHACASGNAAPAARHHIPPARCHPAGAMRSDSGLPGVLLAGILRPKVLARRCARAHERTSRVAHHLHERGAGVIAQDLRGEVAHNFASPDHGTAKLRTTSPRRIAGR